MTKTSVLALMTVCGAAMPALAGGDVASRDEIRAVVAEMLADAETRSSLLADGAVAGHDGKFFVGSADGNYRLNVGGDIQMRYFVNVRDGDNTVSGGNGGDDFDVGFNMSRVRLNFSGNVMNKDWTYKILTRNKADGSIFVEEAWTAYNFGNGWKATWGQCKVPLLHEELVSSVKQLTVERSLVNAAFTQGRTQGITGSYESGDLRVLGGFSDGLQGENTDWTDQTLVTSATGPFIVKGEADFAFTGRVEWKAAGDWKAYEDFTSGKSGDSFAAILGAAAHYQQSPNTSNPANVDRDDFVYTIDAQLKGDSWSAYGAFIGRHEEFRGAGAANDNEFDDFGAIIQGAFRVNEKTELFARWEALFLDSERNTDDDNFHFLTFGANYYVAGHACKFTGDVVVALNETDALNSLGILPNSNTGLLGDSESGEFTIRLQFQLLF